MRFQLISDIHLEHNRSIPDFPAEGDVLLLAGDIGHPTMDNFTEFMRKMKRKFETVIMVSGNHEYYCSSKFVGMGKSEVDGILKDCAKEIGFVFLQNSVFELRGLSILGCTLWTRTQENECSVLSNYINDYRYIRRNEDGSRITRSDTNTWHEESVEFLRFELSRRDRCIVLTHHLPSFDLIDKKYHGHPANSAFASDLSELLETHKDRIAAWCCGHTHSPFNGIVNGVKTYINPVGYPGERSNPYKPFVFET